jgi:LuxR family maltose regulon positive regulatory protein
VTTRPPSGPLAELERATSASANLPFDVAESKLRAPTFRRGMVARTALVDRLVGMTSPAVIAVVAPAGYGKTSLLSQWAERKGPRVGWVSVDDRDNDPVVLLAAVAVALDRIEAIDPRVFRALTSSGAAIEVPRRLVAAIARMRRPVTLVIDNFEVVTSSACHDAIAALALGLPEGSQIAIGSRDEVPVPAGRLRAEGGIAEVGVGDLAMSAREAGPLLREAGVELSGADLDELVRRTEGWPVGLYLAALAVNAGGSPTAAGAAVTGDDRYVGDYLRSEILDRVSPEVASFLIRTSVLDRMCGPLCDAVVGVTGSGALLADLERHNLLVVPLDRRREWYRFHELFRELLWSELRRREPEVVSELHIRAAAWCETNGMPEIAIDHAQAAGDADTAARLVLQLCVAVMASGRLDTVRRWNEWFEVNDLISRYPGIAVTGALQFAVDGRPVATERWADAAEATSTTGVLSDGSTVQGLLAYMRACLCRDGIEAMRRDAHEALHGLSPVSPFRSTMIQFDGVSYLLEGDADRADGFFVRALEEAIRVDVPPIVALVLAHRGCAATERDDWAAADMFADQMLTILEGGQFDDYWTSALAYAWTARIAARRGDKEQARQLVARAARLRPLLTYALPVISTQALLEMARTYLALADPEGARTVLRQANDIFQQRPSLGNLPQQAADIRAKVETIQLQAPGASSLTTAELRLLPLLPTHLSLGEIAERLYVSRHTVRTQVMAIHRKLGVSSRSEAVDRMHELGLLERV